MKLAPAYVRAMGVMKFFASRCSRPVRRESWEVILVVAAASP